MFSNGIRLEIANAVSAMAPPGVEPGDPNEWIELLGAFSLQWIYSGWLHAWPAYEAAVAAKVPEETIVLLRKAHALSQEMHDQDVALAHSTGRLQLPPSESI